jgi:hypothetical protein
MLTPADYAAARELSDTEFYAFCREHGTDSNAADLMLLHQHRQAMASPRTLAEAITRGRELQAPHLDLIDRAFTELADGHGSRMGLFCPPRHGKSRRIRWGALWYLARNPEQRVMVASYSQTLAAAHGRWMRDTIEAYGDLLGFRLKTSSRAADRWDIDGTEGGLLATSVGGSATGLGCSLLIVDDPVKDAQEADSVTIQGRSWDWWQSVALTRLEPGGGAVIIQTRWSQGDLAGRILADEPERWHTIDLPAVALTADEHTALGLEPAPDPLGRQPGDALWPARYPVDELKRIRRSVGERVWYALYQQQPRPVTGTLLSREDILAQRVTAEDAAAVTRLTSAVAVDPSGGGRDEAGVVGGWLGEDQRLYITADRSARMSSEEWSRAACLLAHELQADRIVYESNYGGDQAKLAIRTAWDALARGRSVTGLCPDVVPVHSRKGKLLRAEPIAGQFREDRIRLVGTHSKLEWEWQTWLPTGESPGRIDASVHLAYSLLPVPGSETVVSSPARARPGMSGTRAGSRYSRPVGR